MTTDPAPTDLRNTLEEMRARVTAEGKRNGLPAALQEAIMSLLTMLLTLLAEFRASRSVDAAAALIMDAAG
jgi:hypothetical protein